VFTIKKCHYWIEKRILYKNNPNFIFQLIELGHLSRKILKLKQQIHHFSKIISQILSIGYENGVILVENSFLYPMVCLS
jgi:hypothetical protein